MRVFSLKKNLLSQKNKILVFLILLFLITRILLLLFNFDDLIWHEERYNGTITLEILNGLKMPLSEYQHVRYTAGSVVMGILAAPFFKLFGSSYFSYKLLPLSMSVLTMSLWYLFLFRYIGPAAAFISSVLFIISPPNNFIYSVFGAGHHYESNLFSIAMISIFFSIFYSDRYGERRKTFYFFILGLISGFACYFVLTSLVTVILILIFWFYFDKQFIFKKYFCFFTAAFLIGLSPWIYNTFITDFGTFHFHNTALYIPEESEGVIEKFVRIITTAFPLSFGFLNIKDIILNAYIYYFIAAGSYFYLIWKNRFSIKHLIRGLTPFKKAGRLQKESPVIVLLLFFPIIYLGIYVVSNFDVPHFVMDRGTLVNYNNYMTHFMQFRYFTPLFPLIFVFISVLIVDLWNDEKLKSYGKILCVILLSVVLSFCSLDYLKLLYPPDIAKGFLYCGSDYMVIGRKLASVNRGNIAKALKLVETIDVQYRPILLRGVGVYYGFEKNREFLPEFIDIAGHCDENSGKQLYMGLSYGLFSNNVSFDSENKRFHTNSGNEFDVGKMFEEINPSYRYLFKKALGNVIAMSVKITKKQELKKSVKILNYFSHYLVPSFGNYRITYDDERLLFWVRRIEKLPVEFRPYFYRSLGEETAKIFFSDKGGFIKETHNIPEKNKIDFFRGLAVGSSSLFSKEPQNAMTYIALIDENYRSYFMHSLGKALFWKWAYDFNKIEGFVSGLSERDKQFCYDGIGSGAGFLLYWNPSR